jgi:hypothetical protein
MAGTSKPVTNAPPRSGGDPHRTAIRFRIGSAARRPAEPGESDRDRAERLLIALVEPEIRQIGSDRRGQRDPRFVGVPGRQRRGQALDLGASGDDAREKRPVGLGARFRSVLPFHEAASRAPDRGEQLRFRRGTPEERQKQLLLELADRTATAPSGTSANDRVGTTVGTPTRRSRREAELSRRWMAEVNRESARHRESKAVDETGR